MSEEEAKGRQGAIDTICTLLASRPFKVEFKVVKKPRAIKVIIPLTKEDLK